VTSRRGERRRAGGEAQERRRSRRNKVRHRRLAVDGRVARNDSLAPPRNRR